MIGSHIPCISGAWVPKYLAKWDQKIHRGPTYDSVQFCKGLWVFLYVQQRLDFIWINIHTGPLLKLRKGIYRRDPPQELLHRDHIVFSRVEISNFGYERLTLWRCWSLGSSVIHRCRVCRSPPATGWDRSWGRRWSWSHHLRGWQKTDSSACWGHWSSWLAWSWSSFADWETSAGRRTAWAWSPTLWRRIVFVTWESLNQKCMCKI